MREIKFRYWDGEFKQMCNVRAIVWHNNMIANIEVFDSKTIFRNPNMFFGHALQEFTGLKDKNGKEIYEGDIVKTAGLMDNIAGKVQWSDRMGWLIHPTDWAADLGYSLYEVRAFAEVIGNIYENPELLK